MLDLDALLAADAQGAKREVKDALDGRRGPDLSQALAPGRPKVEPKVLALIKRALALADASDHIGAAKAALKAVDLAPELALANQTMGLCLERMGRLSQAIDFYERAVRFDPNDAGVYYNLGMVAWKLDMLDGAERLYRIALSMEPTSAEATINLAGVLRDQGRFSDSIEILRAAIYANPDNPLFWNSLGTTLLDSNDPEQAITFYRETIRLDPNFARGWHNLGYAQVLAGDAEGSAASSDLALRNPASEGDRTEMIYARAQSLLAARRYPEGWRDYEIRLDPNYASGTRYLIKKPRWDGVEPIAGKRLLFVGEQGVGDEVLFLNITRDLLNEIGPEGKLTVVCESRLIPLVKRSFPEADAVFHGTTKREGVHFRGAPSIENWDEIDLWTPMATPLGRYRDAIEKFPSDPAYLVPDPARVAEFRAALAKLPAGPKVGLCWKSKLMNAKRSKYYSPFEDWKHVLRTPGLVFVNLQYGDVSEEIPRAKEHGAVIHEILGLDLMKDLDGVAALGAALDLAIGPLNASTNLAAACGCPTWFIALNTDWVLMGTDRAPWYPMSRAFWPTPYGDWTGVMKKVAAELARFEPARRAA